MGDLLLDLFKSYGIIDPNKKLFPKYVYGLKQINKTNLITTSGITVLSHSNSLKFLNFIYSSEIVTINLQKIRAIARN